MDKRIARCSVCTSIEASSTPSFGVMKPDIVFFGESLPELFYSSLEADLPKVMNVVHNSVSYVSALTA